VYFALPRASHAGVTFTNGKAFMGKTPSQSRNHSMSVCRSTSKRQTSKTEIGGFTARTEGQGNCRSVFIQMDETESEEFVLFEKDFICELQIKIDFCMISYYDEMVRFRTNGGCI
jgi:hypothetical protein